MSRRRGEQHAMDGLQWATGRTGSREYALPAARRRIDWRCDMEEPCRWFGALAEPLSRRTLLVEHESRRLRATTWWRDLAGWCLAMYEPQVCHRPALLVLAPGLGRGVEPAALSLTPGPEMGVWCFPEVEPAVWLLLADQLAPESSLAFLGVLALEGERQRKAVEALIDNPHFSNDDHVALAEAAMSGMLDFVDPDRYPHYARKLERELAKAREEARKEAREEARKEAREEARKEAREEARKEAREEARVEAFLEVLRSLNADQASAIEAIEDPAARQQAAWDALQAALGQRGQGGASPR